MEEVTPDTSETQYLPMLDETTALFVNYLNTYKTIKQRKFIGWSNFPDNTDPNFFSLATFPKDNDHFNKKLYIHSLSHWWQSMRISVGFNTLSNVQNSILKKDIFQFKYHLDLKIFQLSLLQVVATYSDQQM